MENARKFFINYEDAYENSGTAEKVYEGFGKFMKILGAQRKRAGCDQILYAWGIICRFCEFMGKCIDLGWTREPSANFGGQSQQQKEFKNLKD